MQTTLKSTLFSHPDRTLQQHLEGCAAISKQLLDNKQINPAFYSKTQLDQFRQWLVWLHDLGKGTAFFQLKIIEVALQENSSFVQQHQQTMQQFIQAKQKLIQKALNQEPDLSNHAALGACFIFALAAKEPELIRCILYQIIRKHHGDLPDYKTKALLLMPKQAKFFEQQLSKFDFQAYQHLNRPFTNAIQATLFEKAKKELSDDWFLDDVLDELKKEKDLRYFFLQHFLFSLLLSADKGDVMVDNQQIIRANQAIPPNIIQAYKQKCFGHLKPKAIDIKREAAYQDIAQNARKYGKDHAFFSITLPTGMGKTFSAYNAALILKEQQESKAVRVIYCLPFTSIIDQNAEIITKIFQNANLDTSLIAKNHYLSDLKQAYQETELTYQEAEYLTEGWEQEFVVTTFVQLLESIFTNKNKRLRKFHNMVNAVILLDEVQNVPPQYYPIIELTFSKMAQYFNTKFLFITATQPMLFDDKDKIIELTDPTKIKTRQYFEASNRIHLDQSLVLENEAEMELESFVELLLDDLIEQPNKSFLIICNTIKQSQEIFSIIGAELGEEYPMYYLSSSILPFFRRNIINSIKNNTRNHIRQIVVTTQVVEAGVDIDLDVVYRDFAPMDSINQSAGRCNRNGVKGTGVVKLFNLGKGQLIYNEILMAITKEVLGNYEAIIPEKYFYELNQAYFEAVRQRIQQDSQESMQMKEYMERLQLEQLEQSFQLIEADQRNYNVFIPFKDCAIKLWEVYEKCSEITDLFERKRAVKRLKPKLLKFVTKFPKYAYNPPPDQRDQPIIYEVNWALHYDLILGFKSEDQQETVLFF